MSFLLREFTLDKTGRSPANRIVGESHTLGPTRGNFHAVAPNYGPFYNDRDTWRVYRNNEELTYGKDYFGITMVNDKGMEFSGEVCELFLVQGSKEGDIITLDCQILGGLYQNHQEGLKDLWNAFISDNRPIDWKNVFNLPDGFNPAYHLHMMNDVVGWQPVLIALERMTNAITLRNIPAFEKLIDWVLARTPDIASTTEVYNLDPVDKLITLNRLLYAARYMNFNAITFRPSKDVVEKGGLLTMNISSTNFPRIHDVWWEIQHVTTEAAMFEKNSGMVSVVSNEASFIIAPRTAYKGIDEQNFRVVLRQGSLTGNILAESKLITMRYNKVWDWDYGKLEHGSGFFAVSTPTLLSEPSAEAAFVIPGENYWKFLDKTH